MLDPVAFGGYWYYFNLTGALDGAAIEEELTKLEILMVNTIKIKSGSGTPTTSDIVDKELAFDRGANNHIIMTMDLLSILLDQELLEILRVYTYNSWFNWWWQFKSCNQKYRIRYWY